MSAIREEIRAILREELAALRAEIRPAAETVRIASSEDLNRFALELLRRVQDPAYSEALRTGEVRFALAGPVEPSIPTSARPIVSGPPPVVGKFVDKKLVTERDIAELGSRHLRLSRHSRLTPLAQDEARRKGIRIERVEP